MSSESFSLFLSSFTGFSYLTPTSPAANVDMTYLINWDSFFNGANHKYKKCRLRYEYYSDPVISGNQYDPLTYNALLVLTGLVSSSSTKYPGSVLGLLSLDSITGSTITPSSQTCLQGSTMNTVGQNVEVPKDLRQLEVQLWSNAFGSASSALLPKASVGNWGLVLNFELYDPIV